MEVHLPFAWEEVGIKFAMFTLRLLELSADNLDFQQEVKLMNYSIIIHVGYYCFLISPDPIIDYQIDPFGFYTWSVDWPVDVWLPPSIESVQCTPNDTQLSQCEYTYTRMLSCYDFLNFKIGCQITRESEY